MKKIALYLDDVHLGELTIESVRGRETWMACLSDEWLSKPRPMIDPAIANVRGPQFPLGKGGFGFLADVSPDRWGRKWYVPGWMRTEVPQEGVMPAMSNAFPKAEKSVQGVGR